MSDNAAACTLALILMWIWMMLLAQSGESIYLGQCSFCHGQRGEGGRGSVLTRPALRHAPDDEALYRVIRRGIPGSGMPGTALSDREIRQVMTHVRAFGRVVPQPLAGDARRGAEVYQGKGRCAQCHAIGGRGGAFGPDLGGVGARRSPAHLRASLVEPEADVPRGFLQVRAVTAAGRSLTGARVNEDTFSIQIRDAAGAVHSFWKRELRELHKDLGKSPMPGYREALAAAELDDLVAFLAGLQED